MNSNIKTLTPEVQKEKSPAIWTAFLDGALPPAFSYARIIGFIVIITFMAVTTYLSLTSGTLIVPPKEWVYIIITFGLSKPIQKFAEVKDNEAQLNYDFQMAQLDSTSLKDK